MLLSVKYALQNTAPSEKMEQTIPSGLGRTRTNRHLSGVGFMVKLSIATELQNLPVGHSDRIMSLRLPIPDKFATVLSVYTHTLHAETGAQEAFYCDPHNLPQQVDSKDKLIRRLNTRVR